MTGAPEKRRGERETLKQRIAVQAHMAAERLAMALPERVGRRFFEACGLVAFHAASAARRTVQRNQARVLGRRPSDPLVVAATKEAFLSYARYWHHTFFVRVLSEQEMLRRIEFEGLENVERVREDGRGAILALPHLGNWDACGRGMALLGHRLIAVAEELKPRRMFELFVRHRRELGVGIVPLTDTRKVGEDLMKLLAQNELIALVADRDLKGTGVDVQMFGATRKMPGGPALLSLATGVPLLPCATYERDGTWTCLIRPPLEYERTGNMRDDVTALTRLLAKVFERDISADPPQWHMFQPAWDEPAASADGSPSS